MVKKTNKQKSGMEIDDKVFDALSKALDVLEEDPKLKKAIKA